MKRMITKITLKYKKGFTPTPNLPSEPFFALIHFIKNRFIFIKTLFNTASGSKRTRVNLVSGFTIVELIIVLAIVVLIAGVTNFSFSQLSGGQSVDKTSLSVISILQGAHSLADSSKDASSFGVRILKNKIISFEGSYGNSNSIYTLPNTVAISTSSGIGTDIIFNNLYSQTSASGTITIYLISNPKTSSTIQIFSTGEIQRN